MGISPSKDTIRSLASIQEITKIEDINNSTNLAVAQVLGWQVVIKRNEFQVGQKIVYFEIDSILPAADWSDFMKGRKYRVKTVQLRGEISQGLIMPLTILGKNAKESDFEIGKDLTDILNVKKFEEEEIEDEDLVNENTMKSSDGKSLAFPNNFIAKTDEPRIQSFPKYLDKFQGKPYYATIKYDGTSATYILDPKDLNEFYVCSRKNRRFGDNVYSKAAFKYKIEEKLKEEKGRYAIQCEIYGPKIQKNYLCMKKITIAVFTIKDLFEDKYLDLEEMIAICKKMDLPMVEIIEKGDAFTYNLQDLKEKSKGSYPNSKFHREGLVFRLQKDWHKNARNSFKIINDDFLLMGKQKI